MTVKVAKASRTAVALWVTEQRRVAKPAHSSQVAAALRVGTASMPTRSKAKRLSEAAAAVRSLRAKLTADRAFPPAAAMERYYFEDHEAIRKAQKRIEKRLAKRLDRDATPAPVAPPVA